MADYYDLYCRIVNNKDKKGLYDLIDYGQIKKNSDNWGYGCQWATEAVSKQKSLFNDFYEYIKNSPNRKTYAKQIMKDENTEAHYLTSNECKKINDLLNE